MAWLEIHCNYKCILYIVENITNLPQGSQFNFKSSHFPKKFVMSDYFYTHENYVAKEKIFANACGGGKFIT